MFESLSESSEDGLVIINDTIIDGKNCKGDVVIPDGLRKINYEAFAGNTEIRTLTIVKNNGRIETLTKGDNFDLSVFQKEYNRLYKKIVLTNTEAEKDKFVRTLLTKTRSGVIWSVG